MARRRKTISKEELLKRIAVDKDDTSLDGVSIADVGAIVDLYRQLPTERCTPEGLWLVVDDHWRQRTVETDGKIQPVTPEQLFDWTKRHSEQFRRWREQFEYSIQKAKEALEVLGVSPDEDSPYKKLTVPELLRQAEAWKQLQEDVRAARFNLVRLLEDARNPRPVRTRGKRRTSTEDAERKIKLAKEWEEKWRKKGYTQQEFADFHGWESRTPLSDAIRFCKDTFGEDWPENWKQ